MQIFELLGVYDERARGFKDGSVCDLQELTDCVTHTLGELSKKSGTKFKDVYLGVSGDLLDIRDVHTEIPLIDKGSKVIVARDVKKINKQARLLSLKINGRRNFGMNFLKMYKVDGLNSAINPLGLYGRKLGIDSSMVVMHSSRIQNITKAVVNAGYDVAGVYYTTLMASSVLFDENEKIMVV